MENTKSKSGEKVTFTLMPSTHNNLKEEYPMSLTIKKIIPYQEFLSKGFEESLANLKALIDENVIPYV